MKKRLILLILMLPMLALGQSAKEPAQPAAQDTAAIYMQLEEDPEYPGGLATLMDYLNSNIHMPYKAIRAGVDGRVLVSFVVEKDGRVGDVTILEDPGYGCGKAVAKAIKKMPRWKPGKLDGKAVRTMFRLPVMMSTAPADTKKAGGSISHPANTSAPSNI